MRQYEHIVQQCQHSVGLTERLRVVVVTVALVINTGAL